MATIELIDYKVCQKALLERDLKQALYDEGAILMKKVLVALHGKEHHERRVLEMRVFRKDFFRHYENEIIPKVFDEVARPYIDAGSADVVDLGYRIMVYLAIAFAGIDLETRTRQEFDDLVRMLRVFGTAATLAQSKLDRDEAKKEIAATLKDFDERFFSPSAERRQQLIDQFNAGEISEDQLPMDVLTVLLRNEDKLDISRDMLLREVGFYFLAGAHTSVHSLGHVMHHLFDWCGEHPDDRQKLIADSALTQRFVHESFRLHPSSPVSMRKALSKLEFLSGDVAEPDDTVIVNLQQANRDVTVFGADAAEFNPYRQVPKGVLETGITFGIGMHSCLGKALAAGNLPVEGKAIDPEKRQLGMVAWVAHALLKNGAARDPENPGHIDPTITRETWKEYPILFIGDA